MKERIIDLREKVFDLIVILCAIFIFSLTLNVFFSPHQIVPGGVSGLAIVLESVFHIKKSIIIGFLNIPIFVLGLLTLGKRFVINTMLGAFLVPVFVELTSNVPSVTKDPLLAVLVGGVTTGIAIGMLLTKQASVGGTDTVAKMLSKLINKPVGRIMMCIDLSIVCLSVCVFGIEKALYSLVTVYITGRVVDIYIKGFRDSKSVLIISDKIDEINTLILTKINGRTTKLEARGGYTNHEQVILMCVITSKQLIRLKRIVKDIDNNALVLVQDSYEVYGKGFSIN
ncbi:YitT family protein [Clostridium sp. JN-1]|uniref:YitT family protein n=1 Tax=Clostridium sp. JN-1 TaxID=2483110 RepID=UPI000F0BCAF6|nr:YitT family protein [Clostridium sp. JN-1]